MKNIWKSGLIGVVTGFANGLFGSGGGTILVPALQRFLNVDTHKAHATAIAIILPLSVLSMFVYMKQGSLDYTLVLYVSLGGIAGGFLGARYLKKVPKRWLHKIFGLCMAVAAVRMII